MTTFKINIINTPSIKNYTINGVYNNNKGGLFIIRLSYIDSDHKQISDIFVNIQKKEDEHSLLIQQLKFLDSSRIRNRALYVNVVNPINISIIY